MAPKTTLIFGGSGKVAKHLTRQLTSPPNNHTVYSIIRKESQKSDIESLGGKPILQSIEDSSVSDMLATMTSTNPSAVVWAAGAGGQGGPERTVAVDRDGAIRAMDAAAQAGVKRFIMVSAVDIRDREGKPEPEWYDDDDRKRSEGMWGAIGRYCAAKLAADRELVVGNEGRGLEWTIVRPTSLGEGQGTGRVEAGKVSGVSRGDADLQRLCLATLERLLAGLAIPRGGFGALLLTVSRSTSLKSSPGKTSQRS